MTFRKRYVIMPQDDNLLENFLKNICCFKINDILPSFSISIGSGKKLRERWQKWKISVFGKV